MEEKLVEQLVSVVLAALSFVIALFGPTFYFLTKFASTKTNEVFLKVNSYLRATMEGFVRDIYITSLNVASLVQMVVDVIFLILSVKSGGEEEQVAKEVFGEEEVTKVEKSGSIKAAIKSVLSKIKEGFKKLFSKVKGVREASKKEILKGVVKASEMTVRATSEGFLKIGLEVLLKKAIAKGILRTTARKVLAAAAVYMISRAIFRWVYTTQISKETDFYWIFILSIIVGGFPIMVTEWALRNVFSLVDILYNPVVESKTFDRRNDTVKYIASRIKFCWDAFGRGSWNVNYMRGNPALCYQGFFDYLGNEISVNEVVDALMELEKEEGDIFSKGRFVIMIKEMDVNGEDISLIDSKECIGDLGDCHFDEDINISNVVNVTIHYEDIEGNRELIKYELHNPFILLISFGECVPWDHLTFELPDDNITKIAAIPKDKLGEIGMGGSIVSFFTSEATAYSLGLTKCLEPDTLYINFIRIKKDSHVDVTLKEKV